MRRGECEMPDTSGAHTFRRYFIVGGAGFIGSHFTDRLLTECEVTAVTLYDNFSLRTGVAL